MFYPKSYFEHTDKNVWIAMTIGPLLSYPGPKLPLSLEDIENTAKFVEHINLNGNFSQLLNNLLNNEGRENYLNSLITITKEFVPDFNCSDREILSISFRLWSGCIAAAKGLSNNSNSGSIDANFRSDYFSYIDNFASDDHIFAHGVKASSKYRELKGEQNYFEGVPRSSLART